MKKLLFLLIILSSTAFGKFIISAQGFGSQPLSKFNQTNYSPGIGLELGFGYEYKIIDSLMFEINVHFQFGQNGDENIALPIEKYTLSNDFTNSHLEIKVRKKYKIFEPYVGLHVGIGRYHTDELMANKSSNPQESFTYTDILQSRKIFQYGASAGTYIKIRPNFDFGISINFGDESVNFIDLSSVIYEKGVLDYSVNEAVPTVLLFNSGVIAAINPISLIDISTSRQYDYHDNNTFLGDERPVCKPKSKKPIKKNNYQYKHHYNNQKKQENYKKRKNAYWILTNNNYPRIASM
jgi:hypothetical protein